MLKTEAILKASGFRVTPGRKAIIELLADAGKPLSKEDVSVELKHLGLNDTTIYRALDAFWRTGILHRVETGDRIWRYGLCGCGRSNPCHPHFVCRGCGRVECLTAQGLPPRPEVPGHIVEEQHLYMRGLCTSCAVSS